MNTSTLMTRKNANDNTLRAPVKSHGWTLVVNSAGRVREPLNDVAALHRAHMADNDVKRAQSRLDIQRVVVPAFERRDTRQFPSVGYC